MAIKIPCVICQKTGQVIGGSCPICGGDGELDAPDQWGSTEAHLMAMFQMIGDTITKLDTLQSDMDIIKPQIQALYDDLNP